MDAASQISLLNLATFVVIILILLLGVVYFVLANKKTKQRKNSGQDKVSEEDESVVETKSQNYGKFQGVLTRESIKEFMEFEEIVDNMIVRKKGHNT